MPNPTYLLTLGKTYYEKGFFNLGVEVSRFVSQENGPAVLLAGASKTRFEVRIDRDANPATNAPRIFGGNALRNWIQSHFRLGEIVEIQIIGPKEFLLLRTRTGLEESEATADPPSPTGNLEMPTSPTTAPPKALEELRSIGFVDAGHFTLGPDGLSLTLGPVGEAKRALYAFLSDGALLYIGKTSQQLRKRLYFYCKPAATQSTNVRANALIRDLLVNGSGVQVLAFADPGTVKHHRFAVNLAAGLEDDLIAEFRPPWNKSGI